VLTTPQTCRRVIQAFSPSSSRPQPAPDVVTGKRDKEEKT
jgi:hypothetical protein